MHRATGVAVREVAFGRLRSVGPPSDAELCAWWDGAVRDARVKAEAMAKARRLPRTPTQPRTRLVSPKRSSRAS